MKNIFLIIILITTQSVFAASYNKPSASKLYKEAVELVKKEQFESAIKKLTKYTKKKPKDSDGWTLLAFSNRKISEFDKAKDFYEKAISIDENNKTALEYQGEFFAQIGEMEKAKENLEKCMEPFFTTRINGLGLGLSIVENLVMIMNGTIKIKSDIGYGTQVKLNFPE